MKYSRIPGLEDQLMQAHEDLALADRHLATQSRIVERLQSDGHSVAAAEAARLLETMHETRWLHEQHLERIRAELSWRLRSAGGLPIRSPTALACSRIA
jgi:hypothetical protein